MRALMLLALLSPAVVLAFNYPPPDHPAYHRARRKARCELLVRGCKWKLASSKACQCARLYCVGGVRPQDSCPSTTP